MAMDTCISMLTWLPRGRLLCALAPLTLLGCGEVAAEHDGGGVADGTVDAGEVSHRVAVEQGLLAGVGVDGGVAFLGVPFAAPPVGALRWRPPQPPLAWEGPRAADRWPSACPQPSGVGGGDGPDASEILGDEDCLFLNVWTPAPGAADLRPVLVFIHGGGNLAGSTSDPVRAVAATDSDAPLYDGARVAARADVVVVTLQYRLGALGYLVHAALDAESETGTSGNYGLQDLVAGLRWVQANIDAFGGDPDRVLLFGQSAGGRNTLLLATSPETEGLFHGAAVHSAPLGAQDPAQARTQGAALVEELGCVGADAASCLRAVEPSALLRAEAAQPLGLASGAFRPTVDGHLVVAQPLDRVSGGEAPRVPLLLGTLETEYAHRWLELRPRGYEAAIGAMVGPGFVDAVTAQYPLSRFEGDASLAFSTLMSDRNVTCPSRIFARTHAAAGLAQPLYFYRFRRLLPEPLRLGPGAYHTSELLFLFQHLEALGGDAEDRATEEAMLGYWARFAATGDPNGTAAATWRPFATGDEAYLSLELVPTLERDLAQADCDFWDGLRRR
jgi:para-nitrobenzyl esterase